MRSRLIILAVFMLGVCAPARSHNLTLNECLEGGDFIKNAALSRDYGVSRDEFIDRMRSDIQAIQTFPPQLRWFVQDEQDEELLIRQAERVFDDPKAPESHQSDFLEVCVARISAGAEVESSDPIMDALFQYLGVSRP